MDDDVWFSEVPCPEENLPYACISKECKMDREFVFGDKVFLKVTRQTDKTLITEGPFCGECAK